MGCCSNTEMEVSGKPRNPLNARQRVCCTDILVLLAFIAFLGLQVYIAIYALMNGDARRLLFGYDSFGNTCNKESNAKIENLTYSGMNTSGKPYVLFMSMNDPLNSMQVCVSKCPTRDILRESDAKNFYRETNISICRYNLTQVDSAVTSDKFSAQGPCAELPLLGSVPVLFRCVPGLVDLLDGNSTQGAIARNFYTVFELDNVIRKIITDFYISWWYLLILCGAAVVLASVMVLLLRFLASVIVWVIVVLAAVGSIVGSAFLWWTYVRVREGNKAKEDYYIPILDVHIDNEKAFLILSITATVLTVILLLILLVLRKRISLVIALFHEAGKCLVDLPLLLIQPLWTFLILFVYFACWVVVHVHISTIGTAVVSYDKGFPSVKYEQEVFAKQFWWIHLIGFIWVTEFILACQQYVIAASVAKWYFSVDKSRVGCPTCSSICDLMMHHLGSMAFGSMIITIVKIPRYILMYIQAKCEGSENACAKCCLKCCICCLWCLEKILKFINQNAYTVMAVTGMNFCRSACKAFSILASNALRVAAINSVGAFVLVLGKIGIMAGTCAIAVVWLQRVEGLNYYAIPVIVLGFVSFIIAHCFLSVYEMVIDAMLLCFCEDCAINDGSPGKEYYMNTSLMKFVNDSSDKLNKTQARKREERAAHNIELQPMNTKA